MIQTGVGFPNPLFFIGVVEENEDLRLEGRIKVRAFGIHGTVDDIPTEDLPWATLIIGSHDTNFVVPPLNSFVFGFFIDGRDAQQPMILGLIPSKYEQVVDPAVTGWGAPLGTGLDQGAMSRRHEDYGQHTLSRLARGENLEETYNLALETNRVRGIEVAGGGLPGHAPSGNSNAWSQDEGGAGSTSSAQPAVGQTGDAIGVINAGAGFTTIRLADGTIVRRDGTRAWRNNNPGNIEFGDFARSQGAVGSDGRFAVFPTYEAGRSAKESLLFESSSYRDRTIASAINRYAPPNENNTNNYIGAITNAVGVPADTPLSELTPAQRQQMLDAMERVEGFRPGQETPVDPNDPNAQQAAPTGSAAQPGRSGDVAPGGVSGWDEPASGYAAQYPYNRVIETPGGQVIELDSTQGAERIMIWHPSGSYIQMTPSTTTTKSTKDKFDINEAGYHMYIGGNNIITIEGNSHVLVKGNKVEEIRGNYTQIVHGSISMGAANQININGGVETQIRSARLDLESNVENLNLKVGKKIVLTSGEGVHLKSKNIFIQSDEGVNIKGENIFVEGSGTINLKSAETAIEASGNASIKADHALVGGGQLVSINASTVAIDDVVQMANGMAGSPIAAEPASDAEEAAEVEMTEPPAAEIANDLPEVVEV